MSASCLVGNIHCGKNENEWLVDSPVTKLTIQTNNKQELHWARGSPQYLGLQNDRGELSGCCRNADVPWTHNNFGVLVARLRSTRVDTMKPLHLTNPERKCVCTSEKGSKSTKTSSVELAAIWETRMHSDRNARNWNASYWNTCNQNSCEQNVQKIISINICHICHVECTQMNPNYLYILKLVTYFSLSSAKSLLDSICWRLSWNPKIIPKLLPHIEPRDKNLKI